MQVKKSIISTSRLLFLAVIAYFCIPLNAHAATTVSGAITTNTTWTLAQSPYEVTGDISIQSGAVLTIEPGVVVFIQAFNDPDRNLTVVSGAINAVGTVSQPIIFTSSADVSGSTPVVGDWGQIRFLNGTNDIVTKLEHVNIRYGKGITVQAAAPTFNYLNISHTSGSAIGIDLSSSPKGIGNQASNNTINGISIPSGEIAGNVIWGIKGIPYVVSTGVVSVGAAPTITSITSNQIQQGLFVDAVITGTRLTGADSIQFDAPGVTGAVTAGGSDSSVPVRITAGTTQALGSVPFNVRTDAGFVRFATGISVIPLRSSITVTNINPNSMRRDETKSFQITGTGLQGAQVSVPSGLTISNLQTTSTQASFDISASITASLGAQPISVINPSIVNGTATVALTIIDAFPKIDINTIPSAIAPDAVARPFNIVLTNADSVAHTLNFSTVDTSIVTVSPASVTIPAGGTSATVNIAGLIPGYTLLNITSPTLVAVSKQIISSNLLDGAVVSPLLSQTVQVFGTTPTDSLVSIVSNPITVEAYLPLGTARPVVSDVITVDTPITTNFGPVFSQMIEVIAP